MLQHGGSAVEAHRPAAADPRRHDPEIDAGAADLAGAVMRPFAHVEIVADDARAGPHLGEHARAQAEVDLRQQIERERRRRRAIGVSEQILAAEDDAVGDAGGAGVGGRLAHPGRIDVDAEPARADGCARRRSGCGRRPSRDRRPSRPGGPGPCASIDIDHVIVGDDIGRVEPRPRLDEIAGIEAVGGAAPARSARAEAARQAIRPMPAPPAPRSAPGAKA